MSEDRKDAAKCPIAQALKKVVVEANQKGDIPHLIEHMLDFLGFYIVNFLKTEEEAKGFLEQMVDELGDSINFYQMQKVAIAIRRQLDIEAQKEYPIDIKMAQTEAMSIIEKMMNQKRNEG